MNAGDDFAGFVGGEASADQVLGGDALDIQGYLEARDPETGEVVDSCTIVTTPPRM